MSMVTSIVIRQLTSYHNSGREFVGSCIGSKRNSCWFPSAYLAGGGCVYKSVPPGPHQRLWKGILREHALSLTAGKGQRQESSQALPHGPTPSLTGSPTGPHHPDSWVKLPPDLTNVGTKEDMVISEHFQRKTATYNSIKGIIQNKCSPWNIQLYKIIAVSASLPIF